MQVISVKEEGYIYPQSHSTIILNRNINIKTEL